MAWWWPEGHETWKPKEHVPPARCATHKDELLIGEGGFCSVCDLLEVCDDEG